jgi:putative transposase
VPWRNPDLMSVRKEFVRLALSGRHNITELCVAFGISEKTGHKWLARYRKEGVQGLADRPHNPHAPPHQLSRSVRQGIIALRSQHPTWGSRKLRAVLEHRSPEISWPASSTIGELLRREGMVKTSRRRRSKNVGRPLDAGLTLAAAPNDVWTTDFKGEFRLGPGPYCYPLTVLDAQSRFLIGCTGLFSTATLPVQIVFKRLFQCYGLPDVIRSDNGVPFASPAALGRLSKLSVWWIRLGIRPERIELGHPEQNGQHERMHRTLKAEATRPPSATLMQQQQRFDRFRREYNDERPHESLGQRPPTSCYTPSSRAFPSYLPALEYPAHFDVRRVMRNGMMAWRGQYVWLTKSLVNQDVGLEETDTDTWSISFGPLSLGSYHSPSNTFIPELYWRSPKPPTEDEEDLIKTQQTPGNHSQGSPILPV